MTTILKRDSYFSLTLTLTALACASALSACSDGGDADGKRGGSSATGGASGLGGAGSGGTSGSGGRGGGNGPGGTAGTGSTSGTGGASVDGAGGADVEGAGGIDGTGGTEGDSVYVSTVEDLADESSEDYNENEHGLITGATLKRWIDDWENEKPEGIDGRLIILQIVPDNVGPFRNITPNEEAGVFTYRVGAGQFNVPRNNGVSFFEQDIPDGPAFDAWLTRYAVDPREDLIVLTFEQQGNTQNTIVHSIGRAWTFFKYWGVQTEHIAILNGSLNWNATNHGLALSTVASGGFSVPPNNGKVTVKDLGVDNTVLSISVEEIIAILEERVDNPSLDDGVRIVDARGGAEAYGLKKATSTGRTDCTSYTGTTPNAKCSTPFEGRLKGAKSVPWSQFLDDAENGFQFLPYATIKATFDAQSGWDETSDYTIQYCRTNQRSTVTGIVASVILGYPTRLYETSFIEWGHLSAGPLDEEALGGASGVLEFPNKSLVSEEFPFRTDLDWLTEHAVLHPDDAASYVPGGTLGTLTKPITWVAGPNYNDEADISPPVAGEWPKLDPEATTTRLSIDTDRAYLRGISLDELED